MLQVENLTKKFGRKALAVDNVSFNLDKGELCILLGPNGAGKSTTIKSIAGLLRYKGVIKIQGFINQTLDAKRILSYVPETPAIYELLTVKEHIQFIEKVYKMSFEQSAVEDLLKRFDMDDKVDKLGGELSKGMQQKLSIILGVLTNPKVILFDEPMVGLDPKAIKELKALFEELVEKGVIVLVSTHIIDSVTENYDRVLIMKDGKFVINKSRSEVEALGKTLEELFFENTLDPEDLEELETHKNLKDIEKATAAAEVNV